VDRGRGPSWREAHQQLQRIAKTRAALDADEARWLLVARETGAHRELGYGSFTEYLERRLGYAPRTARERIRVAEKLTQLPQLRAALARGDLAWSAVRELTRVAESATEADLIAQMKGKTVREIEEHVAGNEPRLRKLTLELQPTNSASCPPRWPVSASAGSKVRAYRTTSSPSSGACESPSIVASDAHAWLSLTVERGSRPRSASTRVTVDAQSGDGRQSSRVRASPR